MQAATRYPESPGRETLYLQRHFELLAEAALQTLRGMEENA